MRKIKKKSLDNGAGGGIKRNDRKDRYITFPMFAGILLFITSLITIASFELSFTSSFLQMISVSKETTLYPSVQGNVQATTQPKQDTKGDKQNHDVSRASRSSSTAVFTALNDDDDSSTDCPMDPCNLNIVFMGDSLTRFTYYSLAYFLRHNNTWIDPKSIPNLVRPKDFLGGNELAFNWMPWYRNSTMALAPYENCDCYREPGSITRRGRANSVICENRYFYDPIRNNTITYFQAFGHLIPLRGHWNNPVSASRVRQQLEYNKSSDIPLVGPMKDVYPHSWSFNSWADMIRHQVSQLGPPNTLVLNAGKWQHAFYTKKEDEKAIQYSQELRNDLYKAAIEELNIPNVIWKTTTAYKGGGYRIDESKTDQTMCSLSSSSSPQEEPRGFQCLNVSYWTSQLDASYYLDGAHFVEPVYRKTNEQLLQLIGVKWSSPPLLEWSELNLSPPAEKTI